MASTDSRVTIHMAASLDGFIARKDGRVDWMETSDEFADGDTLDPGFVDAFLKTIDYYVMGSRTYETAVNLKQMDWDGRTATNLFSFLLVAICREPAIPLSFIQAILRSS